MLLQRICNDRFGNRFALLTPRQSRPHQKIKPCRFTSQRQARRFMGQLQTPPDYWRQVYLESKLSNKASPRNQRILDEIAEMLYRGTLKFYRMEPLALSSKQPLGLIDSDQTIYAIRPVNYLLTQKPPELKYFADESQAMSFLAETGSSDDELQALLEEHDIDTQPNVKVAAAKALVQETLIVTVTRYIRPPTPDKSAYQTPVFVDKVAGLGPPPSPSEPQKNTLTSNLAESRRIAEMSPTLTGNIQKLKSKNWKFKIGTAGGGSYADKNKKEITIDITETGNPAGYVQTLAHETGHALYTADPYVPPNGLTKDQYVNTNVRSCLKDEGEATLMNAQVREEILQSGGPDIGIAGSQAASYKKSYSDYKVHGDREKAREEIGNIFASKEKPSTDPGKTYADYYAEPYQNYWDSNPPGR